MPLRGPLLPAVTYTDASTDFGLWGVLLLPVECRALFFRTVARGTPTGPNWKPMPSLTPSLGRCCCRGYQEEISFVDNNAGLAWITDGCAFRDDINPLLEALRLQLACQQALKWWERVSSTSSLADLPSREHPPQLSSEWILLALEGAPRWSLGAAAEGASP